MFTIVTLRRYALAAGILAGAGVLGYALGTQKPLAKGPVMPGHETLDCESCHVPTGASLRQQLQANVRAALTGADPYPVGHRAPGNEVCQDCHWRADDRHPVYRFAEPRFAVARQRGLDRCVTCHREHRGGKVTLADAGYCRTCHDGIDPKPEPIRDTSHAALAESGRWDTCLECHDFHGNHRWKAPETMRKRIDLAGLENWSAGKGPSPYGPVVQKPKKGGEDK